MWLRFKRDRTGVICAWVVLGYFLIAALAPVIAKLYGKNPYTLYGQDPEYATDNPVLDDFGLPLGYFGGVTGEHWFGVEPQFGRDVFTMLLYGMRTSLYMALGVTTLLMVTGVLVGLVGGYFGGRTDYFLGRFTDFFLSFPQQLFFIAFMPVVTSFFVDPRDETPTYFRALAILIVLWLLGWMGMARLVRSTVLSLREREFVEAAKVAGASPWRIIRKEILPNVVSPILIQFTYLLPSTILSIAFLSFAGVGFVEPTPTGDGCSPPAPRSPSRTRRSCSSRAWRWSSSSCVSTSSETPCGTPSTPSQDGKRGPWVGGLPPLRRLTPRQAVHSSAQWITNPTGRCITT